MKIKETIERECCAEQDMVPYKGVLKDFANVAPLYFCKHCGELWLMESVQDGDPHSFYRRLFSGQPPVDIFDFLCAKGFGWMHASTTK